MTKTKSKKREWCKKIALISIIAAICVSSTKTIAQNVNTLPEQTNGNVVMYNQIIEQHTVENERGEILNLSSFSKDEIDRLKELFLSMSPEQQSVLKYTFQRIGVPNERIPTKEQFESWKNPAEYGIWLDGKKIENLELNRYQSSDFSLYTASKLAQNAKDFGKYAYHLELNTVAYYKERKTKSDRDETLYLMPKRME